MAIGFVLVSSDPRKEHAVYDALLHVPEITDLHPLFGEYNMIGKVEAPDFDSMGRVIVDKVRTVDGVLETKTLTGTRF